MDVLRVSRNPWGQEVLQGLSWDLLWVFVAAGALFIAGHALLAWHWSARNKRRSGDGGGS